MASTQEGIPFNLPECDSKGISMIQNLTQQAVLLNENGEYQTAGWFIPVALCGLSGAGGYYLKSKSRELFDQMLFLGGLSGVSVISYLFGQTLLKANVNTVTNTLTKFVKGASLAGICAGMGAFANYVIEFFY